MFKYYILYKPFNVLSQFTSGEGKPTLKDILDVPSDLYPVGRLDFDSEGLLIITNDKQLNHRLLNPVFAHEREYWVQVDGTINAQAIHILEGGLTITIDGKDYRTKPAKASIFKAPPNVPERIPPVRYRAKIPTSWISLVLKEGKNRQVRKMTARAGFPTLRLIRHRIVDLTLDNMQPGDYRQLDKATIYRALFRD